MTLYKWLYSYYDHLLGYRCYVETNRYHKDHLSAKEELGICDRLEKRLDHTRIEI